MFKMRLVDPSGRELNEVTVTLDKTEVTELLVAASEIDDGTKGHALIRDRSGTTIAIYKETDGPTPVELGTDWKAGPVILILILLVLVGAFTIARGLVGLLF